MPSEYAGRKTNRFDGGYAPQTTAPLAGGRTFGGTQSQRHKVQTNKNQNTKEPAELQL